MNVQTWEVCDYPWLYFNVIDAGYKCKICEMFPPLSSTGGNARLKFANEAAKSIIHNAFQMATKTHLNTLMPQSNAKLLFRSIADSNLAP